MIRKLLKKLFKRKVGTFTARERSIVTTALRRYRDVLRADRWRGSGKKNLIRDRKKIQKRIDKIDVILARFGVR